MTDTVWLYVNAKGNCVKVFDSSDAALEWLQAHDPDGVAVQWPLEEPKALAIKPTRTDYQILIDTFLKARTILGNYMEDGQASKAVEQLLNAMINDQVIAAISRIEGRKRFGLIEGFSSNPHHDAG